MTDRPQSAPKPRRDSTLAPAAGKGAPGRSTRKGDVPEAILDRYLVERDLQGRAQKFFRDHRADRPLFQDRGGSLVSDQSYPDAVADMLKIARHRGWNRVKVTGDAAFRREVWVQAQSLGLEVAGHRPRDRDRQAAATKAKDASPGRTDAGDRLARAAVVVRRLIPDPEAQTRLLTSAQARVRKGQAQERPRVRDRMR